MLRSRSALSHSLLPLVALVVAASCVPGAVAPQVTPRGTLRPDEQRLQALNAETGPLRVVHDSPVGQVGHPNEITIVFNKPMRALSLSPTEPPPPVTVTPALEGQWEWVGTRALRFTAKKPIPRASSFKVEVSATARSVTGETLSEGHSFSFSTERPKLLRTDPDNGREGLRLDEPLLLTFNQPIADEEILRAVTLRDEGGTSLVYSIKRTEAGDLSLAELTAKAPFAKNTTIKLDVDDSLRGTEGPLEAGAAEHFEYKTFAPLDVLGISCDWSADGVCTPGRWLTLEMTTPVKLGDLKKALSIEPPVKLSLPTHDDVSTTTLDLTGAFLPGRSYTLRIKPTLAKSKTPLRDDYGQTLSSPYTKVLRFGDTPAEARIGVLGSVLEPSQASALPVYAINARKLEVVYAALDVGTAISRENASSRQNAEADPPGARKLTLRQSEKNKISRHDLKLEDVLGSKTGRGPVLVKMRWENERGMSEYDEQIVQVTDLAISAKVAVSGSIVWVTSLSTGKPVAGATVEIWELGQSAPIATVQADASGIAQVPGSALGVGGEATRYIVARSGNDVTYRNSDQSLSLWRYGGPYDGMPSETLGILFTERGLYRPGEQVRVKGIVRGVEKLGLKTPAGRKLQLQVTGPEGDEIASYNETLSAFGTFSRAVTLPAGSKLGSYELKAELLDEKGEPLANSSYDAWRNRVSGSFEVAEYRAAEFKVTAETDRDAYMRGDELRCKAKGAYLYGAPMAGVSSQSTITRQPSYFSPPSLEGYATGDETYAWAHQDASPRAGELESHKGKLDAGGEVAFSTKLDLPGQTGPELVTCETEVEDVSRQTFSGRASAIVHPGELYVGLKAAKDLFTRAGEALSPEVVAAEPSGKRRAGVAARVELYARTYNVARKDVGGGRMHSETQVEDKLVGSCQVTTGAAAGGCKLTPPTPGYYVMRATLTDSHGNQVHASEGVYAMGEGGMGFPDGDDQKLELVPSKPSYKVGETAQVLVKSPFPSAEALVTVEREGILSQRRVLLTGAMPTIDIPVTEAFLPNAHISVLMVRGRTKPMPSKTQEVDVGAPAFRLGFATIDVDHDSRKLRVTVKPSKKDYKPGETVDVDVEVKDAATKGTRAEVTLYAADEGALSLIGYKTPDPLDVFFAPRGSSVSTIETRDALARIASSSNAIGFDKGLDGGGGGDAARRDFKQTAYYEPALLTDDAGKLKARFKLPDSLTSFRIMAVATGVDDRFGSADATVTTSKPLMIRPALPRLLRAGDKLDASVVIASKGTAGQVEVKLAAEGVKLEGEAAKTVRVESGQSVEVRFSLSAPKTGTAKLSFKASVDGAVADAVEVTRPITSPTMLEAVALYGDTTSAAGEQLGDLSSLRDDTGGLDVSLSSTALTGLQGSVDQLIEYPYGCTEQMASRLVPLLPLRDMAKALGLGLPKDLDATISQTITKLLANQHDDGGFGLWAESSRSDRWLTAYALWSLDEAKRHGVAVRESAITAASRFLRDSLSDQREEQHSGSERAFALDVLAQAGSPDQGELSRLFEKREELPWFARALLLHAMVISGSDKSAIADLTRELSSGLRLDGPYARIETGATGFEALLDSPARTSAMVLRALVAADPAHPLAAKLALGLLADRKGGSWRSTQETAWALIALDDYRRAQERVPPSFDARVFLGDNLLGEVPFRDKGALGAQMQFPMTNIGGSNGQILAFEAKGQGHLFYEARLRFARKQMPTVPSEGGFYVERRAAVVTPEQLRAGAPPTFSTIESVPAGALLLVDLSVVTPSTRTFVVLDDPLPAGLEGVNARLAGTADWLDISQASASASYSDDGSESYDSSHYAPLTRREVRDDRVVFFIDEMPPGAYHYRYLARATALGTFSAPPARIEEMYTPETFGHTAGHMLTVAAP